MRATATVAGWSPREMAHNVAADLPEAALVNLGIGLPTLVAGEVDPARGVIFHSENGIVGMGAPPAPGTEDPDLIDAGKSPVTLVPGAAIVDHVTSFGIIRGGRLDFAILGAYEVSERGDLASWRLAEQRLGSIGGAMDIAVGARHVYVLMQHTDKAGAPKLVTRCSHPLTAPGSVERVYTNLGVFELAEPGFVVIRSHPEVSPEQLQALTGAPLHWRR